MNPKDESVFYANVPVSKATVVPDSEDADLNGFAFSLDFGIMVALGINGNDSIDFLKKMRQNENIPTNWKRNR